MLSLLGMDIFQTRVNRKTKQKCLVTTEAYEQRKIPLIFGEIRLFKSNLNKHSKACYKLILNVIKYSYSLLCFPVNVTFSF